MNQASLLDSSEVSYNRILQSNLRPLQADFQPNQSDELQEDEEEEDEDGAIIKRNQPEQNYPPSVRVSRSISQKMSNCSIIEKDKDNNLKVKDFENMKELEQYRQNLLN